MSHLDPRTQADGAVAVTTALILVVLVMVTALVVDIGLLRMDRRESQLSADLAASAAFFPLEDFDPDAPGAGRDACEQVWDYVLENTRGLDGSIAVEDPSGLAPCSIFGTVAVCDPLVPVTSRVVADPYVIEMTTPVLDATSGDPTSERLMFGRSDGVSDGSPCERFGVRIQRERPYFFGVVEGFLSGATQPSAVARFDPGESGNFASLIVLEQRECLALDVSGQGGVTVVNYEGDVDDPDDDVPGEITIDSDANGSCGNSEPYALHVRGSNQGYVRAEGAINHRALEAGGTADKAYEESDLTTTVGDGGPKLAVKPTPGERQLREPVDHLVNCRDSYTLGSDPWAPQHETEEMVPPCPASDPASPSPRPPYVERLHTNLQAPSTPLTEDTAWTVYPDDFPGASCKDATQNIDAADTQTDSGDPITDDTTGNPRAVGPKLYINCGTSGGDTFAPATVTMTNVEHVVTKNRIQVSGGSSLFQVDGHATKGTVLYFQDGDLTKGSQGQITFTNIFVYMSQLSSGFVSIGAGSPTVTWKATQTDPVTTPGFEADCEAYVTSNGLGVVTPETPPASCFGPVGLWSNGTGAHLMGGQGDLVIAGSFFTPNASPFELKGDSTQTLDAAQFFSRYLNLSGQGDVTMTPNPNATIETSGPTSGLIR